MDGMEKKERKKKGKERQRKERKFGWVEIQMMMKGRRKKIEEKKEKILGKI